MTTIPDVIESSLGFFFEKYHSQIYTVIYVPPEFTNFAVFINMNTRNKNRFYGMDDKQTFKKACKKIKYILHL